MSDDLEKELRDAMKFRVTGAPEPVDLAARVRRRHERYRRRIMALTAAAVAVIGVGGFTAYQTVGIASKDVSAQGADRRHGPGTIDETSATSTDLCAVMPRHWPRAENDFAPDVRYPVPGLQVGYLPRNVRQMTPDPIGETLGKGPDWYRGYGWRWDARNTSEQAPQVSITVLCGPGAQDVHHLTAAERFGNDPGWAVGRPVTIHGMATYYEKGGADAYMFVRPGTVIAVNAVNGAAQDLRKIVRGIHTDR